MCQVLDAHLEFHIQSQMTRPMTEWSKGLCCQTQSVYVAGKRCQVERLQHVDKEKSWAKDARGTLPQQRKGWEVAPPTTTCSVLFER